MIFLFHLRLFFRFQPFIFHGVHHLMAKHQIFPTTQAHAAINKPYLFLIEAGRWPGHSVVRLRIVRPYNNRGKLSFRRKPGEAHFSDGVYIYKRPMMGM